MYFNASSIFMTRLTNFLPEFCSVSLHIPSCLSQTVHCWVLFTYTDNTDMVGLQNTFSERKKLLVKRNSVSLTEMLIWSQGGQDSTGIKNGGTFCEQHSPKCIPLISLSMLNIRGRGIGNVILKIFFNMNFFLCLFLPYQMQIPAMWVMNKIPVITLSIVWISKLNEKYQWLRIVANA